MPINDYKKISQFPLLNNPTGDVVFAAVASGANYTVAFSAFTADIPAVDVLSTELTGLTTGLNQPITSGDTILSAFENLQASKQDLLNVTTSGEPQNSSFIEINPSTANVNIVAVSTAQTEINISTETSGATDTIILNDDGLVIESELNGNTASIILSEGFGISYTGSGVFNDVNGFYIKNPDKIYFPFSTISGDTLAKLSNLVNISGGTFNTSTGVITLTNSSGGTINISGLTNMEVTQVVETISVNDIDTGTTAVLIYGINVVTASTITDFCARLPITPQKGKSVTVVNTSNYKVRVFPSMNGGKINNVVDGYFDVPNDGLPYVFVCYENPNPGYWGTTNRPSSNLSVITFNDMVVSHTGGTESNYVGTNTSISSAVGSGIDMNNNLTLTPNSTYWGSENSVATATNLRVYTNIVATDFNGDFIQLGLSTAYKTSLNGATSGNRGSTILYDYCVYNPAIGEYCNTVSGGVLNAPPEIGDVGTYYVDIPIGTDIGLGGTQNPYSRFYYIFWVDIGSSVITKDYKFRFELVYV